MSFIEEIREVANIALEGVKFSFWIDELAVYLFDEEIPITVIPSENKIFLDVEGYSWRLTPQQISVISDVMAVLNDNMNEIIELTKDRSF